MKKTVILLLAVALLLPLFCSCEAYIKNHQIEDRNGENDSSIVTITDEQICSGNYSQVTLKSVRNTKNGVTTQSVELFSGIMKLSDFNADDDTVTVSTETELKSGNLRLVVVSDKKIVGDLSASGTDSLVIKKASGSYKLLAVGESANFELIYTISKG